MRMIGCRTVKTRIVAIPPNERFFYDFAYNLCDCAERNFFDVRRLDDYPKVQEVPTATNSWFLAASNYGGLANQEAAAPFFPSSTRGGRSFLPPRLALPNRSMFRLQTVNRPDIGKKSSGETISSNRRVAVVSAGMSALVGIGAIQSQGAPGRPASCSFLFRGASN